MLRPHFQNVLAHNTRKTWPKQRVHEAWNEAFVEAKPEMKLPRFDPVHEMSPIIA
jgi:hypothetical protein